MPYVRETARGRRRLIYRPVSAIEWTQLGGILWVGISIWLLILLGLFAVTVGFRPAIYYGIEYELPSHRLGEIDIQRLLGGQIVRLTRDGRNQSRNGRLHNLYSRCPWRGNGAFSVRFNSI